MSAPAGEKTTDRKIVIGCGGPHGDDALALCGALADAFDATPVVATAIAYPGFGFAPVRSLLEAMPARARSVAGRRPY